MNNETPNRRQNLRRLAVGAIGAIALATGLVGPGSSLAATTQQAQAQAPTQDVQAEDAATVTPAPETQATTATPLTTTISLRAQSGGFFGYVHSTASKCEGGRVVTLYLKANGTLTKVGTDVAQPNGPDAMYSINTKKKGTFVAKVPATASCKAAASPAVAAQA